MDKDMPWPTLYQGNGARPRRGGLSVYTSGINEIAAWLFRKGRLTDWTLDRKLSLLAICGLPSFLYLGVVGVL